jgi:hypothetical protein
MPKEIKEERDGRPFKLFGILLPSLPSLMIRFGGTFLRFKRNAKKAGKVFKKELINQGLDKQVASELTDIYMEGSDLSKFIQIMN